jgi:hypothetical protein
MSSRLGHRGNVTLAKRLCSCPATVSKSLLTVNTHPFPATFPARAATCPPDQLPIARAITRAKGTEPPKGSGAEPPLGIPIEWKAAAADDAVGSLGVFLGCMGSRGRRHTYVVAGAGLAPDVALLAGVGSEGPAAWLDAGGGSRVIGGRLGADVGGDAHVVAGVGFAPDISCFDGVSRGRLWSGILTQTLQAGVWAKVTSAG